MAGLRSNNKWSYILRKNKVFVKISVKNKYKMNILILLGNSLKGLITEV